MSKIDPALRFLTSVNKTQLRSIADDAIFAAEAPVNQPSTASVLIQFSGDLADIEAAGFQVRSVAGDVATGEVDLARLDDIAGLNNVVRVEASRALYHELDLALPEIRADLVHSGPPGHRGSGVIVGVIDSGIDFQHEAFRRSDGTSRILAIWDQRLVPQAGESSPAGFGYGVEFTESQIDAALASANPLNQVRHQDLGTHGTHVAGIAAGDGSVAGQGQPANTFIGVAPEADLVIVANTRGRAAGERGLGDSADTLDAVRYIFDVAASLRRPVVINQSQGDNVGPHDGTSLLERGIDNLLGGPGRSMVKSAGNEGNRNCHASGTVVLGGTNTPSLNMPTGRAAPVTVDIWYQGADRLAFSITPPGGAASAVVNPNSTTTLNLPNGNQVFVDSALNDPGNNDNRIFVVMLRGSAAAIQPGTWTINLQGQTVTLGQWDAWIQRGDPRPQFLAPMVNPARTISVPGTAHKIVTAASYITRGAGVGSISAFSSLGPTRDARQAPIIAAPGQFIMAPQPPATGDPYGLMAGTSMAAPMVTGTIAMMLQKNANLTQDQIRDCLTNSARADASTGSTPNNAWGAGKLDAFAAFQCVPGGVVPRTLRPPCPPRTIAPPCHPVTTRPPCPIFTLGPPCPPLTLAPPCPPRTIGPPCPPLTLGPPCPAPTLGPGCPRPTLGPPCPAPTLGPTCGGPIRPGPFVVRTPLRGPEHTSGGWGYPRAGWAGDYQPWTWYGPHYETWYDPHQQMEWPSSPESWDWYDPNATPWDSDDSSYWPDDDQAESADAEAFGGQFAFWYGNRGY
jgi:subtilisin family serine protease